MSKNETRKKLYYDIMQQSKKNKGKKKDLTQPLSRLIEHGNTIINKRDKKLLTVLQQEYPKLRVIQPQDEKATYLILQTTDQNEVIYR